MSHGHHHHTLEEEKETLESYKRDLEDEISRVKARIKKISK
jgi:predicted  nucleic acid-binding Zn-ribbon protein